MNVVSKTEFFDNAIWKFLETICKKIISLVLSTIIARLLIPEAYGLVALTTVFITFSDIFILNGFNVALIRKDKVTELDYSTVLFLSLIFSTGIYIIIFICSPLFAQFYESAELNAVLRVITLLLFPQSLATVIRSKGTRELRFKEMSLASLASSIVSSIIGVLMAYKGFGVWALVAQQVLTNFFDMLFLAVVFKWHFSLRFSFDIAKQMLSFTGGVLGASFLDFLGNNINGLVIGKVYSPTDLGYYNRGNTYPETISLNVFNSINSVLLPTLASRQNDAIALKSVVGKVIAVTEYMVIPMMFGLIAISDRFVSVLLTEKWTGCIPLLICACLYYAVNPVRAVGYSVFYAKGESKKCFNIEIIRSIMMICNLLFTIVVFHKSIFILSLVNVFISLVVMILTQYQVKKSIGYGFFDLAKDICPSFFMSLIMLLVVRAVSFVKIPDYAILIIQIILGTISYLVLSIVSKNMCFYYIMNYCKSRLKRDVEKEEKYD